MKILQNVLFIYSLTFLNFCNSEILNIRSFQSSVENYKLKDRQDLNDCKIIDQRSVVNYLFIYFAFESVGQFRNFK